ncbi:hypothetical protein K466DRAFT_600127 [Polyporus arcularius HHB13444]|uniref:Uncharacterized protein n=1 Tax=Polyporus arcularius HHB13444 TaxID=1314778 RepID=A0A5C3PDM1_9APHY|nr:hypothetical protein K466DRAFT_600127 [Polyporus arcularius HHB13444]
MLLGIVAQSPRVLASSISLAAFECNSGLRYSGWNLMTRTCLAISLKPGHYSPLSWSHYRNGGPTTSPTTVRSRIVSTWPYIPPDMVTKDEPIFRDTLPVLDDAVGAPVSTPSSSLSTSPVHSEKNLRVYDRDIHHITSSWPALRKLVLDVAWSDNEADFLPRFPDAINPPTVHTLAEYAQAHPQLEHLLLPYVCIPSDMVGDGGETLRLDSIPAVLDHGLETLPLRTWGLFSPSSTGGDNGGQVTNALSLEFASLLNRLFPRLRLLQLARLHL